MYKYLFAVCCSLILGGNMVFAQNSNQNSQSIEKIFLGGNFSVQEYLNFDPKFSNEKSQNDINYTRYVSADTPLNDKTYKPKNLVSIAGPHINEAGRSSMARADIKSQLDNLAEAYSLQFNEPLIIVSGFRSAEYQQRIWDLGRCDDGAFCAIPGHSEHQLGLAFDFFDATSSSQFNTVPRYKNYVKWMSKNAHKYGFTQSYQHGPLVDNYEVEPWHWRYIGADMASKLHDLGWSYTRYIKFSKALSNY